MSSSTWIHVQTKPINSRGLKIVCLKLVDIDCFFILQNGIVPSHQREYVLNFIFWYFSLIREVGFDLMPYVDYFPAILIGIIIFLFSLLITDIPQHDIELDSIEGIFPRTPLLERVCFSKLYYQRRQPMTFTNENHRQPQTKPHRKGKRIILV